MKHIQAWILWILGYWFIRLPLIIIGFVVIPVAYVFRKDDHFPRWAWLWDNEEDGIFGAFWFHHGILNFKTCFKWSALRNPVNNMRFTWMGINRDEWAGKGIFRGHFEIPSPNLARTYGKAVWHYSLVKHNGIWYPSFWYIRPWNDKKHFRIRLGWKCTHKWISNDRLSDTGKYSGICFQFLPYRNG